MKRRHARAASGTASTPTANGRYCTDYARHDRSGRGALLASNDVCRIARYVHEDEPRTGNRQTSPNASRSDSPGPGRVRRNARTQRHAATSPALAGHRSRNVCGRDKDADRPPIPQTYGPGQVPFGPEFDSGPLPNRRISFDRPFPLRSSCAYLWPNRNGIDSCRELSRIFPRTRTIVVTVSELMSPRKARLIAILTWIRHRLAAHRGGSR